VDALMPVAVDTAAARKARGAFFTPPQITNFIAAWAIRAAMDRVLEPSAGDAAFLTAAVARLQTLGTGSAPVVHGVEIHADSVRQAVERVTAAGGVPRIVESDFFLVDPDPSYSAVIGNPPYIRYQDFSGTARARSRAAALRAGVALTGLASSWAAFTVHSALFLQPGGRMGLVLPAELLSVNYAAAVRQFLFDQFASIELVLFQEQVFPEAEADVVLLLADGYQQGPTDHALIRQVRNADDLAASATVGQRWTPASAAGKWTGSLVEGVGVETALNLAATGAFTPLETWGDTTLGMVTGSNAYFALSPNRVSELQIPRRELIRLSPPGSAHLRGLALTERALSRLGAAGRSTWLFRPDPAHLSVPAQAYIAAGHAAGVDQAYKCRVRTPWYRVPLVRVPDLLLTCMNADTPRLTTNSAGARHLNSVHGVYLQPHLQDLARELLPVASLNSVTVLHAEIVGRSYGGGILKLEPREADIWFTPAPVLIEQHADQLRVIKPRVQRLLAIGRLREAVEVVDAVLLAPLLSETGLTAVRTAHRDFTARRVARAASGR
jgi:adenine-specific DNA-methyltransferase